MPFTSTGRETSVHFANPKPVGQTCPVDWANLQLPTLGVRATSCLQVQLSMDKTAPTLQDTETPRMAAGAWRQTRGASNLAAQCATQVGGLGVRAPSCH
eukprot:498924-Amphidinium_carterae.1